MDWDIVQTVDDLETYVSFLKNDFRNNKAEWENTDIDACFEAAMACLYSMGDRSAGLNNLYDNVDIKGLRFAAILFFAAAFKLPVSFATQNMNEDDFSANQPKGVAFAIAFDRKWKVICDAGFHIEESMECFFDKIISLLNDKNINNHECMNIQVAPNILTFIACVLNLGKYYE